MALFTTTEPNAKARTMNNIAKCPKCKSSRVKRTPGGPSSGPVDACKDCGASWAHKPGTVTAEQLRMKAAPAMQSEHGKMLMGQK